MQPPRPEGRAMTFDEVSMERSKSFVKALQELKNLRPQLYSAAEYCERSYLNSEQKQMVLDNLKDYAVRALVNAVDHLGTVAFKLTDLFEQQMFDASTVETRISCLSQQSLTCHAYVDKEGCSQHQLSARTLRHYKHYTLPSLPDKNVKSSMQLPPKSDVNAFQAKTSVRSSRKSASKTLSWHLATEVNSTSSGISSSSPCIGDPRTSKINPEVFHLLVPEEPTASLTLPNTNHLLAANGRATSDKASNKFGLVSSNEASKPAPVMKPLHGPGTLQIYKHRTTRGQSLLSVIFSKPKILKSRNISVS
ncbi:protein ABIL1-like isoform X1 [Zingiber officinale]|uniref:protein ABIL1-like isoform X1 n=1 Tax=Zingiber officinale TaxID=94328 RepID=UPI001C4ABF25|nr:protein ABIL1-like isoform X1 [Zingiber officinale]